jgi:hypothetical protein
LFRKYWFLNMVTSEIFSVFWKYFGHFYFIDFVIPKFFFIDVLNELGLFIGEKQVFTKKKSVTLPSAVNHGCPNENFVRRFFERSFQVRHFSIWITEIPFQCNIYFRNVLFPDYEIPQNKLKQNKLPSNSFEGRSKR